MQMTRLPVDEFSWDTAKHSAFSCAMGSFCSCHLLWFRIPFLFLLHGRTWLAFKTIAGNVNVTFWHLRLRSSLLLFQINPNDFCCFFNEHCSFWPQMLWIASILFFFLLILALVPGDSCGDACPELFEVDNNKCKTIFPKGSLRNEVCFNSVWKLYSSIWKVIKSTKRTCN